MSFIERDRELRAEFDKLKKRASYGTAGFRDLATNMPYVLLLQPRSFSELEHWSHSTTKLSPINTSESSFQPVTTRKRTMESKSPTSEGICSRRIFSPKLRNLSIKTVWSWLLPISRLFWSKEDSLSMTRPLLFLSVEIQDPRLNHFWT